MTLIEKAKELIAKGEKAQAWQCICRSEENDGLHASDCLATITCFEESANPADLLPPLRLLVECEEFIEGFEKCNCPDGWTSRGMHAPDCYADEAGALLDKFRSES